MPQIYNLGGLVIHRLQYLHTDRLRDASGVYPIMEITYTPETYNLPDYKRKTANGVTFRNVEKIISNTGKVIYVDTITEG